MAAIDQFLAVEVSSFSDPLLKRYEDGVQAGPPRGGNAELLIESIHLVKCHNTSELGQTTILRRDDTRL